MVPVLVLLVGLPGTGKLTVARALVRTLELHGREVRLVDSHHIANPVLELVAQDGVTLLPPGRERSKSVSEADAVERAAAGCRPCPSGRR